MPKREILVLQDGSWTPTTITVRARNNALETESSYERTISIQISEQFGHEGKNWMLPRGTRQSTADFNALMTVTRSTKTSNINELLSALNRPQERRAHHNKYAKFSKQHKRG